MSGGDLHSWYLRYVQSSEITRGKPPCVERFLARREEVVPWTVHDNAKKPVGRGWSGE
jgi:hypothetical protein